MVQRQPHTEPTDKLVGRLQQVTTGIARGDPSRDLHRTRRQLMRAIGRRGPEAVPSLIAMLEHYPDVQGHQMNRVYRMVMRLTIATTLGYTRTPAAAEPLIDLLKHDKLVSRTAALALARIRTPEAKAAVREWRKAQGIGIIQWWIARLRTHLPG
nr:HEAT repeat domain-containing protein [Anaerolineae bacterium]